MKPLLQIALDNTNMVDALKTVSIVGHHVDIIEAGTILCVSEGIRAVSYLRALFPDKIIACDLKTADAGDILARQAFSFGASWMTVVCAAPLATMLSAKKIADEYKGEIQVELFGGWTMDDAKSWCQHGIRQAIYHRGRDAQAAGQSWSPKDLDKMKALSDLGLELSVTGGIIAEDLHLFKDINVKVFIAGRAISGADDPVRACAAFKAKINDLWS